MGDAAGLVVGLSDGDAAGLVVGLVFGVTAGLGDGDMAGDGDGDGTAGDGDVTAGDVVALGDVLALGPQATSVHITSAAIRAKAALRFMFYLPQRCVLPGFTVVSISS